MKDADGDGIPDDQDKCPDTASGTTVSPDSTQGGRLRPAPGEPINLEGCATGESVVLKGVNFELDGAPDRQHR